MSRSGIVQPNVLSYKSAEQIVSYGEALASSGLVVRDAVNGFGLVSRGLLWEYTNIWIDSEFAAPLTTSWASSNPVIATTWSNSNSSITTSWSNTYTGEPI